MFGASLRNGTTRSCGCLSREETSTRFTTHGMHGTPTYKIWRGILTRCHNPKATDYAYYGGRGIFVCDRWRTSFENFFEDMGPRPDGLTIERGNNSLGYFPANCTWATREEQSNNQRSNRRYTYAGKTLTAVEWSVRVGVDLKMLRQRLWRGWPIEKALTEPGDRSQYWCSVCNHPGHTKRSCLES